MGKTLLFASQILFPKFQSAHAEGRRLGAGGDSDEDEDFDPNLDMAAAMNLDEDPEAKFLRERMVLGGKCPSESSLDAVGLAARGLRMSVRKDAERKGSLRRSRAVTRRFGERRRSRSLPNKSYVTEGPLPVKNDYDSLISEIEKQKEMIARAAASREARRNAPIIKRPSTASLLNAIPAKYPPPPPIIK